jgi:hypothetical protein
MPPMPPPITRTLPILLIFSITFPVSVAFSLSRGFTV